MEKILAFRDHGVSLKRSDLREVFGELVDDFRFPIILRKSLEKYENSDQLANKIIGVFHIPTEVLGVYQCFTDNIFLPYHQSARCKKEMIKNIEAADQYFCGQHSDYTSVFTLVKYILYFPNMSDSFEIIFNYVHDQVSGEDYTDETNDIDYENLFDQCRISTDREHSDSIAETSMNEEEDHTENLLSGLDDLNIVDFNDVNHFTSIDMKVISEFSPDEFRGYILKIIADGKFIHVNSSTFRELYHHRLYPTFKQLYRDPCLEKKIYMPICPLMEDLNLPENGASLDEISSSEISVVEIPSTSTTTSTSIIHDPETQAAIDEILYESFDEENSSDEIDSEDDVGDFIFDNPFGFSSTADGYTPPSFSFGDYSSTT